MSQATCNAETQAANDLREFDMEIEYYGGTITRRILIVRPDISADELIKMIRSGDDDWDIGDVFVHGGVVWDDDGVLAHFYTMSHEKSASGDTYYFRNPKTGKSLD